jgi:hypothetical protein
VILQPFFRVQVDLDLPQIAVIGAQSAGKSSLIESISGVTLPRASGTCTRFKYSIYDELKLVLNSPQMPHRMPSVQVRRGVEMYCVIEDHHGLVRATPRSSPQRAIWRYHHGPLGGRRPHPPRPARNFKPPEARPYLLGAQRPPSRSGLPQFLP